MHIAYLVADPAVWQSSLTSLVVGCWAVPLLHAVQHGACQISSTKAPQLLASDRRPGHEKVSPTVSCRIPKALRGCPQIQEKKALSTACRCTTALLTTLANSTWPA